MVAEPRPGQSDEAPDQAASDDGPQEDMRAKFRDALKRKQQRSNEHGEEGAKDPNKVHGSQNVGHRREFRRKSG